MLPGAPEADPTGIAQIVFEQIVFAGGGHRCWWQAGFWDVVRPALDLRPRVIAAVSAGAATACMLYANDSRTALDYYKVTLSGRPRNLYPGNLWRRGKPMFPHHAIYRGALRALIGGARFRDWVTRAPEIRIAFARVPRWLGPRSAVGVGLLAYNIEKYWRKPLHPTYGRRLGFLREVARVQDCTDDDDLISLIIASSCTPPFTPIEFRGGRPTMDGGMVDNVPIDAVEDDGSATLVMVTRRYPAHAPVFVVGGRVYVQPSRQVPVANWDYTAPDRYEATYALGRADGEAFLQTFASQPAIRRAAASAGDTSASG